MTIQHIVTRFGLLILDEHYSGKKFFIPVFGTAGLSATWRIFSCQHERTIFYKTIIFFELKSLLTFLNPLYVFKFKSGWNVYELRIGVQTFVFFVYIDKVLV